MRKETVMQHPLFKENREDIIMEDKEILQKTILFKDYEVVIQLPIHDDVSESCDNNIICFKSGKVFWEIKQLLECYSRENHINYFHEMYFDISKKNDRILTCRGFYNHCVIDVYQKKIISIINNR